MAIRGFLRNTRTKPTSRRLTLYFDKKHRSTIPVGKKVQIVLDLGQGPSWHATMNSDNPTNEPYVHDWLANNVGKHRCTGVFDNLGLAEQAELEFDLIGPNYFRLIRVLTSGQRRP